MKWYLRCAFFLLSQIFFLGGLDSRVGGQETSVGLEVAWTLGNSETDGWDQFGYVAQIGADRNGNIWVLDAFARHIRCFDSEGNMVRTVGRRGFGPGEFLDPFRMAVGEGFVVVRDLSTRKYVVFDSTGSFLRTIPAPVAMAIRDPLVVRESSLYDARRIFADSISPHFLYRFGLSGSASSRDSVEIPFSRYPAVEVPTSGGRLNYVDLPYSPKFRWTVLPSGNVLVSRSSEYHIEVFMPDFGTAVLKPAGEIRSRPRGEPIPEDLRVSARQGAEKTIRAYTGSAGVALRHLFGQIVIPEVFPEISGLFSDQFGRVWVQPPTGLDGVQTFDIFLEGGEALGKVSVDLGKLFFDSSVFTVTEKHMVLGLRTEDDIHLLRAFHLPSSLRSQGLNRH